MRENIPILRVERIRKFLSLEILGELRSCESWEESSVKSGRRQGDADQLGSWTPLDFCVPESQ